MSHFTVLIIGSNPEEQLEPFQENNMDDCPEEYLEFEVEIEAGKEKEYQEKELSGSYWTNDEENKKKKQEYLKMTPEEFIEEYASYEQNEETGDWGYMCNPNAKWDWFQVGGRWAGMFLVKEGIDVPTPNFSHGWDDESKLEVLAEKRVDQAIKNDIDFEGMQRVEVAQAKKRYENLERVCGGTVPHLEFTWKEMLENKDMSIEEKREAYKNQHGMLKFEEAKEQVKNDKKLESFLVWLELDDYQCTKIEYLDRASRQCFSTFAVLKDGKWFERGEMLMFGCAKDEKDEDVWQDEFNKLIKDLPDDTLLTVVDCHI